MGRNSQKQGRQLGEGQSLQFLAFDYFMFKETIVEKEEF